jgi:uncharacterized protein DUF6459
VLVRVIDLIREARAEQQPEPQWQAPPPIEDRTAEDESPRLTQDEATAVAAAFVRPLLEVLEGRRPLRQLSALLGPEVSYRLEMTLSPGARRVRNSDLRMHKVRVCLPHPRAIEACAVVQAGARFRAIALRLEHDGRWRCTALRLG